MLLFRDLVIFMRHLFDILPLELEHFLLAFVLDLGDLLHILTPHHQLLLGVVELLVRHPLAYLH